MVREIRIYVEGGGKGGDSKAVVRAGFSGFLEPLRRLASERGIGWNIIVCGPRNSAVEKFLAALQTHPDAFNLLLVDAEAPVMKEPREHLQEHEKSWPIADLPDERFHLMAQMVEAWLVADPDALATFYGQGFLRNALPRRKNVEHIGKEDLLSGLERATAKCRTKGTYHKIHHCPELLKRIDRQHVRQRARHCDRLFTTLEAAILSGS
jgi:hypothetical protein